MKPTTLLIALSVAVNATLGVLLLRSVPPGSRAPLPAHSDTANANAAPASVALRAALQSGDFDALRAAGGPAETARTFASGSAYARYRAKLRAIQPAPDRDPRYWHGSGLRRPHLTPDERAAFNQAERE